MELHWLTVDSLAATQQQTPQAVLVGPQTSVAAAVVAAGGDAEAVAASADGKPQAFSIKSKMAQFSNAGDELATASEATTSLHAMVVSVGASQTDAVVKGMAGNEQVSQVLENFKTELHQLAPCIPPGALSGLAAAPRSPVTWPSAQQATCSSAANKMVWYGERCSDDMSQILWLGLYAADRITNEPVTGCTRTRSPVNAQLNALLFGGCGTAPSIAPNLPTTVCLPTSSSGQNCLTAAAARGTVATTTAGVVTAVAKLAASFTCGSTVATTVTLSGTPCGPGNRFVKWDSVRPGNCAIIRRSLTNTFRNADWLGQCGVPAARMRSVAINACAGTTGGGTINTTPNRLPRVAAASTDTVSTGLERIEAAEAAMGSMDPNSRLAKAASQDMVVDISAAPTPAAVAVLDTGVAKHPDLNVAGGYSTIDNSADPHADLVGHGTHVAGIIAAKNGGGYTVGVSPGAAVYSVRVLTGTAGGGGDLFGGLYWVVDNAKRLNIKVINLSMGAKFGSRDQMMPYCDVFNEVVAQGVTVVVSAGNDGTDLQLQFPAGCPQTLVVTAVVDLDGVPSADDKAGDFSNYLDATKPSVTAAEKARVLAAPGWDIISTVPLTIDPSGVGRKSGTSQASPFVAGVVLNCYLYGSCSSASGTEMSTVVTASVSHYTEHGSMYGYQGDPLTAANAQKYYGYMATGAKW